MNKKIQILLIAVVLLSVLLAVKATGQQKVTLGGYVRDGATGEDLIGGYGTVGRYKHGDHHQMSTGFIP